MYSFLKAFLVLMKLFGFGLSTFYGGSSLSVKRYAQWTAILERYI